MNEKSLGEIIKEGNQMNEEIPLSCIIVHIFWIKIYEIRQQSKKRTSKSKSKCYQKHGRNVLK
jgi:hypothetical protein